jgi:hypothetical protein
MNPATIDFHSGAVPFASGDYPGPSVTCACISIFSSLLCRDVLKVDSRNGLAYLDTQQLTQTAASIATHIDMFSSARRLFGQGQEAQREQEGFLAEEDAPRARLGFWKTKYPDQLRIQSTSSAQTMSPLFRLPAEIREAIYLALWRSAGLSQHILVHHGGYTHAQCVTDHEAPDERQEELQRLWGAELESWTTVRSELWVRRLDSQWCNHWKCEEKAASRKISTRDPFLTMLLVCKRMYLICLSASMLRSARPSPLTPNEQVPGMPGLGLRQPNVHPHIA